MKKIECMECGAETSRRQVNKCFNLRQDPTCPSCKGAFLRITGKHEIRGTTKGGKRMVWT